MMGNLSRRPVVHCRVMVKVEALSKFKVKELWNMYCATSCFKWAQISKGLIGLVVITQRALTKVCRPKWNTQNLKSKIKLEYYIFDRQCINVDCVSRGFWAQTLISFPEDLLLSSRASCSDCPSYLQYCVQPIQSRLQLFNYLNT